MKYYAGGLPDIHDRDLRRLFSDDPRDRHLQAARHFCAGIVRRS
ncbi:MAG: hypothetical protein R3C68_02575 [Myxococcota bacterium]